MDSNFISIFNIINDSVKTLKDSINQVKSTSSSSKETVINIPTKALNYVQDNISKIVDTNVVLKRQTRKEKVQTEEQEESGDKKGLFGKIGMFFKNIWSDFKEILNKYWEESGLSDFWKKLGKRLKEFGKGLLGLVKTFKDIDLLFTDSKSFLDIVKEKIKIFSEGVSGMTEATKELLGIYTYFETLGIEIKPILSVLEEQFNTVLEGLKGFRDIKGTDDFINKTKSISASFSEKGKTVEELYKLLSNYNTTNKKEATEEPLLSDSTSETLELLKDLEKIPSIVKSSLETFLDAIEGMTIKIVESSKRLLNIEVDFTKKKDNTSLNNSFENQETPQSFSIEGIITNIVDYTKNLFGIEGNFTKKKDNGSLNNVLKDQKSLQYFSDTPTLGNSALQGLSLQGEQGEMAKSKTGGTLVINKLVENMNFYTNNGKINSNEVKKQVVEVLTNASQDVVLANC